MDKNTQFSSFKQWLQPINFQQLDQMVKEKQSDKYVKKLTTKAYILLFLYAHLQQEDSLRSLSTSVLDDKLQEAIGLSSISAAQLSRKNNAVDPQFLANILLELVAKIKKKKKPDLSNALKIVDSTTVTLNPNQFPWAHFRKTKSGVKLHLRLAFMGKGQVFPEKAVITPAQVHDRTQLDVLVDEKNAMYVFDRGYIDYQAFDRFSEDGMFFASRLKRNAVTQVLHSYDVPEKSNIITDQMIRLGDALHRADNAFRLITVLDDQGKTIRIVTNRFDLNSTEISEIYKARWAIELFFKWIKQHVRIKKFYGQSEAAIQNQIYLALIYHCLMVLIQQETDTKHSLLKLNRWLKALLWQSGKKLIQRIKFQRKPKIT